MQYKEFRLTFPDGQTTTFFSEIRMAEVVAKAKLFDSDWTRDSGPLQLEIRGVADWEPFDSWKVK